MKCPKCGFEQGGSSTCINCGVIFEKFRQAQTRESNEEQPEIEEHSVFRYHFSFIPSCLMGFVLFTALGIWGLFSTDFLEILLGVVAIGCIGIPILCVSIYVIKTEVILEDDKIIMAEWSFEKKIIYYKDIYKIEIFNAKDPVRGRAKIYYQKKKITIGVELRGYEDLLKSLISKARSAEIIENE